MTVAGRDDAAAGVLVVAGLACAAWWVGTEHRFALFASGVCVGAFGMRLVTR